MPVARMFALKVVRGETATGCGKYIAQSRSLAGPRLFRRCAFCYTCEPTLDDFDESKPQHRRSMV